MKPETIRKAYYRSLKEKERSHGNQLLTDLQEKALATIAVVRSEACTPMTPEFLMKLAREAYNLDERSCSRQWCSGFIKRWSHVLQLSKPSTLDIKRVKAHEGDIITPFIAKYKEVMSSKKLQPHLVFNVDESGAAPGPQHLRKTLNAIGLARSGQATGPTDSLRTVLPFVNAAGEVVMLVLIFKKVAATDTSRGMPIYYDPSRPMTRKAFPFYYASTASGYINIELWEDCIKKFVELIRPLKNDLPALLFIDRHSSHMTIPSLQHLLKNGIEVMFSTSSHHSFDLAIG